MDLVQLRYFLKIVECGSFTRAASLCNVSQPALSQQISKLEKELELPLFERQGRQVSLTPVGQILREQAQRIVFLVEETKRQLNDEGQTGRVTLATDASLGPYFSTRALQWLQAELPKAELSLSEQPLDAVLCRLDKGDVDIAILPLPLHGNRDLTTEAVLEEDILVALPADHPAAQRDSIQPSDLNGERLILPEDRNPMTRQVLDYLDRHGVSFDIACRAEQFLTLQHLVTLGKGIAFLPSMAVSRGRKGNLAFCHFAEEPLRRTVGLCWKKDRYQTQLLRNLINGVKHFSQFKFNAPAGSGTPSGGVSELATSGRKASSV